MIQKEEKDSFDLLSVLMTVEKSKKIEIIGKKIEILGNAEKVELKKVALGKGVELDKKVEQEKDFTDTMHVLE